MTARSIRRERPSRPDRATAAPVRDRWRAVALAIFPAALLAGCSLLQPPDRSYVRNEELLAATARGIGFEVDPEQFVLVGADVRDDVVTLQYTGKAYPGDQAWVMRFSEKSTEQDPIALSDVHSLAVVLSEGRRRFEVIEVGEAPFAGEVARYLRYSFESPFRNETGEAFTARGILVVLRIAGDGNPLIYHFKLDNYGDRESLDFDDLAPLLEPLAKPQ